jgi:hypothetical protein
MTELSTDNVGQTWTCGGGTGAYVYICTQIYVVSKNKTQRLEALRLNFWTRKYNFCV